jgi:hypothetical protein
VRTPDDNLNVIQDGNIRGYPNDNGLDDNLDDILAHLHLFSRIVVNGDGVSNRLSIGFPDEDSDNKPVYNPDDNTGDKPVDNSHEDNVR